MHCFCLHDILQTGESLLYLASFNGHQKCVQLLLEAGAIVDVQKDVSVRVSVVVFIISIPNLKYSSNRRSCMYTSICAVKAKLLFRLRTTHVSTFPF